MIRKLTKSSENMGSKQNITCATHAGKLTRVKYSQSNLNAQVTLSLWI